MESLLRKTGEACTHINPAKRPVSLVLSKVSRGDELALRGARTCGRLLFYDNNKEHGISKYSNKSIVTVTPQVPFIFLLLCGDVTAICHQLAPSLPSPPATIREVEP